MKKLKIIQRVVSICLLVVLLPFSFGGVLEVHAAETFATMTFTLPDFVDGTAGAASASDFNYSLDLQLLKYDSSGKLIQNEWFKEIKVDSKTYTLTNGAIVLSGADGLGYESGTSLTISDIPFDGIAYGSDYDYTTLTIKVICEDINYDVEMLTGSETAQTTDVVVTVLDGETFPKSTKASQAYEYTYALKYNSGASQVGTTNHTLSSLLEFPLSPGTSSSYSYTYIDFMNYFNVVTLEGDIEGNHLVGPIVSSNRAYRSLTSGLVLSDTIDTTYPKAYNSGTLDASDYSNGIFSYVHTLTETGSGSPTFSLKYGYDANATVRPYLYTKAVDTLIIKAGTWEVLEYVQVGKSQQFRSPNNEGRTDTLKNDNFLNSSMETWMKTASSGLKSEATKTVDGVTDRITIDSKEAVTIKAGGNYLITNAKDLKVVNIEWGNDAGGKAYEFFTNPYPYPTTINFDDTLRSVEYTIGSQKVNHYLFPEITINGVDMAAGYGGTHPTGLNGEYANTSYSGNKIVWNFSGMTDRMILPNSNIPGHILAPEIEIWNYAVNTGADTFSWTGGNLNGAAIVKEFHGGIMELHMFPYGEAVSISTVEYSFKKYKESITKGWLAGASFTVTGPSPTDVLGTFISGSDGIVTITGLEKGETYEMKETQAPSGYERSEDVWTIEVAGDGTISIKENGVQISGTLEITNKLKDFTLPNTGGGGVVFHYVIGMISIGMAALLIGRKKICG